MAHALQKAVKNYLHLLKGWNASYQTDSDLVEISFNKNEITIIFSEDLREHITNFSVLHPKKRIAKVYYRKCFVSPDVLGSKELVDSINALGKEGNKELQEVKIYFNFLLKNNIL